MKPRTIGLVVTLLIIFTASQIILAAHIENAAPDSALMQQAEPTIDPFPRPNQLDLIVAEQVFEGGRMFYLLPADRIWVMLDGEDKTSGTWLVFENIWQEGQPELDPAIHAPDGMHQPIRGFGAIWRENTDVQEALGWALDPEIGYMSYYEFTPGEMMIEGDEVIVQPGIHELRSYYGSVFIFDEAAGTWMVQTAPMEPEAEMTPEATEEAGS